jgi:hypothetical protein
MANASFPVPLYKHMTTKVKKNSTMFEVVLKPKNTKNKDVNRRQVIQGCILILMINSQGKNAVKDVYPFSKLQSENKLPRA